MLTARDSAAPAQIKVAQDVDLLLDCVHKAEALAVLQGLHQEVAGAHPDGTANTPGTCVRAPGRLSIQEAYEPRGVSFGSGLANPT